MAQIRHHRPPQDRGDVHRSIADAASQRSVGAFWNRRLKAEGLGPVGREPMVIGSMEGNIPPSRVRDISANPGYEGYSADPEEAWYQQHGADPRY